MESFELMVEKSDKTKVNIAVACEEIANLGHDHLHSFKAWSEFRPIEDNNKLEKIVVAVVIEGNVQDREHTKITPINFQVDLKSFETIEKYAYSPL